MAIFTRFGTRVEFVSAEAVPVLIEETQDGERRWHYPEKLPAKRRKTSEYEEDRSPYLWRDAGGFRK